MKLINYFITLWLTPYKFMKWYQKIISTLTLPFALFILPFNSNAKNKVFGDAAIIYNEVNNNFETIKNRIGDKFERNKKRKK